MKGRIARAVCLEKSQTRAMTNCCQYCDISISFFRRPHTQILHILVADYRERAVLGLARTSTCAEALKDDNTVGDGGSNKGGAVGVTSPSGVVVEGEVGHCVADSAEQKGDVAGEPAELQRLHQRKKAFLH